MPASQSAEDWDWDDIPDASVCEIIRMAELQLSDILQIAIAADQRAAAQAAVLAGFGATLLAVAGAAATAAVPQTPAAWASLSAGLGLMAAAFLSGVAARPADYYPSGYSPRKAITDAADLVWLRRYTAEELQFRIDENRRGLVRIADQTARAYHWAIASIGLGVGVFIAQVFLR